MLCCPCFPLRKKRKVQPEPVSTPERRPRRRPRRLFKKRKTGDAVIPEKDIVASQEPLAKDVPQVTMTTQMHFLSVTPTHRLYIELDSVPSVKSDASASPEPPGGWLQYNV
ncbi:hypothetical protein AALO_G00225260 [Alosa alosa]|uniref:Uncharacterized protein n=1 Tax=Alosa alosa TaxID=278164 RepID=A0AAV6FY57_9TELE|nr:hypothetical protein AALO_G00225260 [Alosa alosa]